MQVTTRKPSKFQGGNPSAEYLKPGTKLVKYKPSSEFEYTEAYVISFNAQTIHVSPVWPFNEGLHHRFTIPVNQYSTIGPWDKKTPWGISGESLVNVAANPKKESNNESSVTGSPKEWHEYFEDWEVEALIKSPIQSSERIQCECPVKSQSCCGYKPGELTLQNMCLRCKLVRKAWKLRKEGKLPGPATILDAKNNLIAKPKPETTIIEKVDGLDQIALFPKEEQPVIVNRDAELYGYIAKNKSDRQRFKRKLQRTKDWINELPSDEKKALLRMVSELSTPPLKN